MKLWSLAPTLAVLVACSPASSSPDAAQDSALDSAPRVERDATDASDATLDALVIHDSGMAIDGAPDARDASSPDGTNADIGIPSIGPRVLVGNADFEAGPTRPRVEHASANWYGFEDSAGRRTADGALRIDYPTGEFSTAMGLVLARLDTREVFIQFRARMPGPRGGLKFFKIFGHNPRDNSLTGWNGSVASNYANSTFGLDYTGIADGRGSLYYIAFGDGTLSENDTANGIWLDGSNPRGIGRSYSRAVVATPQMRNFRAADWGDGWHTFRMMMRFNSGATAATEVADGAYFLEIDGRVYARATGILNRHPSNQPSIDRVEIGGWAQSNEAPFSIEYDDVTVTTGSF